MADAASSPNGSAPASTALEDKTAQADLPAQMTSLSISSTTNPVPQSGSHLIGDEAGTPHARAGTTHALEIDVHVDGMLEPVQTEVAETRQCAVYLQGRHSAKRAQLQLEATVIDVRDQIAQLFKVDTDADLSLWMLQPAAEGQDQGEVQDGVKLKVCAARHPWLPMGP